MAEYPRTSPQFFPNTGLILAFLMIIALDPRGAPCHADPPDEPVESVEITGLTSFEPGQILDRLRTREGKTYDSSDIREDLDYLSGTMETASVETHLGAQGWTVHFNVREYPRYRKFQAIGNQRLKDERIEGLLRDVKKGDVLDEKLRLRLTRSIRNEYKSIGMPQALVKSNVISTQDGENGSVHADLQFIIDEGQQVLCRDVIIKGNSAFTKIRLRTHMNTKGSWGFVKNFYDDFTFEEDLDSIRAFYHQFGYFDAEVERGMFEEETAAGKMVISPVIEIKEGSRYRFGEFQIVGARLFSRAELHKSFNPLLDKPFDGRRFREAAIALEHLYYGHGLLTTEFNTRYEFDPELKQMKMTIEITEHERIHVGKIILKRPRYKEDEDPSWFAGFYEKLSPQIRDETIKREILLKPGDVYNKQMERQSIRRLAGMHVFRPKGIKAYNSPTRETGVHDMAVEIEDEVTGRFGGGIGYNDLFGGYLYLRLSEKNLGGHGDQFKLETRIGTENSSAEISHLNRHLGDSNRSLLTRLYYHHQNRPGYDADISGLAAQLKVPLERDWSMYLSSRMEKVNMDEESGVDADVDLNEDYWVTTGAIRFTEDNRTPIGARAREGYLQDFDMEAGWAGAIYVRFGAKRDQYWPVSDQLTYRMQAKLDLIPFSRNLLPVEERIFMGGSQDLRGFRYRHAGYVDRFEDDVPIGGSTKILIRNELIRPLFGPVEGVLFLDAGALGASPTNFGQVRASTGAGLRFDFQHAQIGLDLAVPFLKDKDDETRFFHFSLKSQF
jgi:outer membrane protein insertion porin family